MLQRNKINFGTRAFDDKPTPVLRPNELLDPTRRELETRKKKGTLVSIQRLLANTTHAYVLGQSRTGKSASTVIPYVEQMLLPFDEHWATPDGEQHHRENLSAIVFIDGKADKSARHTIAQKAEAAGRKVQYITLDPERSWRFNLLSSFTGHSNDAANISANLLTSLNLDLGGGYGANFFTVQTLCLLFDVCNHLSSLKRGGGVPSVLEAIRYIKKNARSNPRDSDSLLSTLSLLSHYPHLQPIEGDKYVVDMVEAILNRHVVIVSVDALNQGPVARLVAGLVLSSVLAACTQIVNAHAGDPSPSPHCLCVVDEFQHFIGRNAQNILTGAAGVGLTFCLCAQSVDTLKTRDLDLSQVVWDNCGIRCIHTAFGDQDVKNLQALSRDTVRPLGNRTLEKDFRFFGRQALNSESESDRIEPSLTRREIQEVSAKKNRCFICVSEDGFKEPIPTDTYFAETYEEHLANRAKPWPESPPLPGNIGQKKQSVPKAASSSPAWLRAHLSTEKDATHAARLDRFNALLKKLRDEELPGN